MNPPKTADSDLKKQIPRPNSDGNKTGVEQRPDDRSGLFRSADWIAFGITTLITLTGYIYTLAPNLTLEDAGELAVGSYYAGVPHPPGYPVWTLYSWLLTLIPYSNIAWRVALSSAVAGALACGLLALLVSRSTSLIFDGIYIIDQLVDRQKRFISIVAGSISGLLLGFNGIMWSQSVIVEVYTLSVLSFMAVLCSLFRWIYSPDQRKYLYWAFFWFGICFTNHQTLIVAAMGIEIAILCAHPKLGRDLFIGNSIVYVAGLIGKAAGALTTFDQNLPLFTIYNAVGLGSVAAAIYMTVKAGRPLTESKSVLKMLGLWTLGAAFCFYMPLASMSNPPMNWSYPRTVEGLKHALTRGQYEPTNPTSSVSRLLDQAQMYVEGLMDEFSLVYLLIGLVPLLFFKRMSRREKSWLIGLSAIFICLAGLLLILLNPNTDRLSRQQTGVFFAASHIMAAIAIGSGVALICSIVSSHYSSWRTHLLKIGAAATGLELYLLIRTFDDTQLPTVRAAALLGLLLAFLFTLMVLVKRTHIPIALILGLFAMMPARSILAHWADNEQRGHLFGYWFGHDMFSPPFDIYPEMPRNSILFGGTDPGRFTPTYMIFCESFMESQFKPHDPTFDRRDVYIITQNALADPHYLEYIRAHYNRSMQADPYFFSELFRSSREKSQGRTNILARSLLPLDRALTRFGSKIEQHRRSEGVYPSREIRIPGTSDYGRATEEYIRDAARRLQHDLQFPNERKQVKPGEGVQFTTDGGVQINGHVAIMSINALLTKQIFDENPDHEFLVEESMPLDWMFPHLSPFGTIMKVNRKPVPKITEEIIDKDHQFWSHYSARLTGDWITYDTNAHEICEFTERTYGRHDFIGFKGDPKFARDDHAQRAFSKLRSATGFLYWWRLSEDCPADLRATTPVEQQRLVKEAEFAYKQAFAFCPLNPEALHKYVTLLVATGRVNDAVRVAQTSLRFDPDSELFRSYYHQLRSISQQTRG